MPDFRPAFATDKHGCPSCGLELVPHPITGRWVCPRCKFERATMHEPRPLILNKHPIAIKFEEACTVCHFDPASVLAIAPPIEIHPITTVGEISPMDISTRIDAEIALAEATPNHADPDTVFLSGTELGRRWNISANGALMKAERLGIPILKNNSGFKAVRLVDLEKADDSKAARLPRKVAEPRVEPAVEPITSEVMPLPDVSTAIKRDFLTRFEAVQVGDSERVRRLLLALKKISQIANEDPNFSTFAIQAVADYAIEAETDAN